MSVIPERRRRLRTASPANGTPPPTSPVLPPWGTRAIEAPRHRAMTSATSATVPGRITAEGVPVKRPVQSLP